VRYFGLISHGMAATPVGPHRGRAQHRRHNGLGFEPAEFASGLRGGPAGAE